METVKVDIQKLQLLNDRIAQTIDALNQVRMSAHGIQHTPAIAPWGYNQSFGNYGQPFGMPQPFAASPFPQQFGVSPFGVSPFGSPFFGGLQHTTSPVTPWGTPTPWNTLQTMQTPWNTLPTTFGTVPTTMPQFTNGISHSTYEPYRTTYEPYRTQSYGYQYQYPYNTYNTYGTYGTYGMVPIQ
jgi:hypothetical protein